MFIEVQEGIHSPKDNSLTNITLVIAQAGNYSVTLHLTESQAKDLATEITTNGLRKFDRFKVAKIEEQSSSI